MGFVSQISSRKAYGLLGIPIDVDKSMAVIETVVRASRSKAPFLASTINLHFLIAAGQDPEFRRSLLVSDLCTIDGMPVLWLARLLGLPAKTRVAGSDLFDALRNGIRKPPVPVFFFGGPEGVAEAACRNINATSPGVTCVGSLCPGFGSIEEMSSPSLINTINASGAEFLAVSLGAKKGQAWLLHNHSRLHVPVRVHLGATVNFQAGSVKRAPRAFKDLGAEWVWRIIQEPHLWRRYSADALALATIVATRVIPLIFLSFLDRLLKRTRRRLKVDVSENDDIVTINLSGAATETHIEPILPPLERAIEAGKHVRLNCAELTTASPRFFGLLLVLNKELSARGKTVSLLEPSTSLRLRFKLNGFGYLFERDSSEWA